jgi:hypothetical protein
MKSMMAIGLAGILLASLMVSAKDKTPTVIPKGAQIGVVNLMDAGVVHYHAAKDTAENFLKLHPVNWSIDDMLNDSLQQQLKQLGLTPVPVAASDALLRSREDCFVNMPLAKGLPKGWPKNCAPPLMELAASAGVSTLIVLAPGLDNSGHAGSSNRDGLSETLRGWGFFTRGRASTQDKPVLFDETELLLIGVTPAGATLLARKWGGTLTIQWESYTRPDDLKQVSPAQLDELKPLFAALLTRQAKELLDQAHVEQ